MKTKMNVSAGSTKISAWSLAVILLLISTIAGGGCTLYNKARDVALGPIPLTDFTDGAHHWYDINDQDKVIEPLPNQPLYKPEEYEKIADNILLFQKSNGGWPKNYDMQAVLTEEQKAAVKQSVDALTSCFDNGATHAQMMYLGEVIARKNLPKYRDAYTRGLKYILEAQYANGGWPQFYPDTSGYRKYITYNDGAMTGIMRVLQRAVRKDAGFVPADSVLYEQTVAAYNKGLECILKTQIKENDTLLVWGQQHDEVTLELRWARTFEPAAICNGESADVVEFLMSIENPSPEVKNAVESAVAWFNKSGLEGIRIWTVPAPTVQFQYNKSSIDRMVMPDSAAPTIWARYYQPKTHVPIFCNRDGVIVYTLTEVERERRVGYAWYIYSPQNVLNAYPAWKKRVYD